LPFEIRELKDELVVRAEVPGFEADDLTIEVNGNRLVIKGENEDQDKDKDGKTICTDHMLEHIYKMVELPMAVLAEEAKAVIKNGVSKASMGLKGRRIPALCSLRILNYNLLDGASAEGPTNRRSRDSHRAREFR
jgi:Hsp20/alpha crystallin family